MNLRPDNKSGLPGIRFALQGKNNTQYVHVAAGDVRRGWSLSKMTPREAIGKAITLRMHAGLPVPSLNQAMKAYKAWLETVS